MRGTIVELIVMTFSWRIALSTGSFFTLKTFFMSTIFYQRVLVVSIPEVVASETFLNIMTLSIAIEPNKH